MATDFTSITEDFNKLPHTSEFRRFSRVFFKRRVVFFGLIIIAIFFITATFAEWISPYDPYETYLDNRLAQPSRDHLLGTDTLGRDTLSRIIYGARSTLMIGVIALSIAALVGISFIGTRFLNNL